MKRRFIFYFCITDHLKPECCKTTPISLYFRILWSELRQGLAGPFSMWHPWCSTASVSAGGSKMASFKPEGCGFRTFSHVFLSRVVGGLTWYFGASRVSNPRDRNKKLSVS